MKTVPTSFTKWKAYQFNRITRTGNIALYEQVDLETDKIIAYEVVIIQSRTGRILPGGGYVGPGEYYPTSAQWGSVGWTYCKLNDAMTKMDKLIENTLKPVGS